MEPISEVTAAVVRLVRVRVARESRRRLARDPLAGLAGGLVAPSTCGVEEGERGGASLGFPRRLPGGGLPDFLLLGGCFLSLCLPLLRGLFLRA